MAARIAIIAITTSNSIKVKAARRIIVADHLDDSLPACILVLWDSAPVDLQSRPGQSRPEQGGPAKRGRCSRNLVSLPQTQELVGSASRKSHLPRITHQDRYVRKRNPVPTSQV